jgi:hypothetical protein
MIKTRVRITILFFLLAYVNAAFATVGTLLPWSLRSEYTIHPAGGADAARGIPSLRLDRRHAATIKLVFEEQCPGCRRQEDALRYIRQRPDPPATVARFSNQHIYASTDSSPPSLA